MVGIGVEGSSLLLKAFGLPLFCDLSDLHPGDGGVIIGVAGCDLFSVDDGGDRFEIESPVVVEFFMKASATRTTLDLFDQADPMDHLEGIGRCPPGVCDLGSEKLVFE